MQLHPNKHWCEHTDLSHQSNESPGSLSAINWPQHVSSQIHVTCCLYVRFVSLFVNCEWIDDHLLEISRIVIMYEVRASLPLRSTQRSWPAYYPSIDFIRSCAFSYAPFDANQVYTNSFENMPEVSSRQSTLAASVIYRLPSNSWQTECRVFHTCSSKVNQVRGYGRSTDQGINLHWSIRNAAPRSCCQRLIFATWHV